MDKVSEKEVYRVKISGTAEAKVKALVKKGHGYIEAKMLVIKANFTNAKIGEEKRKKEGSVARKEEKGGRKAKEDRKVSVSAPTVVTELTRVINLLLSPLKMHLQQ